MASEVIVLAHGTFDLLHIGHVIMLQQAKALGTKLVVSITTDPFVEKGAGRPVFPAAYRAYMLSALRCVDSVYFCHEATGVSAIETIRPDIYIKGQDYDGATDWRFNAERAAIEKLGGRLVLIASPITYSSTALLNGNYLRNA
jgi:rfaE bifunctional protein nucleotidyltransferase chain/domain